MEEKYTAPGPIFEPRPGWGGKLKKWAKKYILGGDCTLCRNARYALVFGIVVLIIMTPKINEKKQPSPITESGFSETIRHGDGQTHLARRILAKYLAKNTEIDLNEGQKIFIETILREAIPDILKTGNEVKLESNQIKTAIEKSELLTPSQIHQWEKYTKIVKSSN